MAHRMVISAASIEDAQALSRFAIQTYVTAFGEGFVLSDLAAHIERNISIAAVRTWFSTDVVLRAGGETSFAGFVQFGPVSARRPHEQELRRLYVAPDQQNQGVGTALLRAALAHDLLRKADRVFLDVSEQNSGAIRLYERFGFVEVGRRPFRVASGAVTGFDLVMVREREVAPDAARSAAASEMK